MKGWKRGVSSNKSSGISNRIRDIASRETMLYTLSANVAMHTALFFLLLIHLTVGAYQFSWQVSGYFFLFWKLFQLVKAFLLLIEIFIKQRSSQMQMKEKGMANFEISEATSIE